MSAWTRQNSVAPGASNETVKRRNHRGIRSLFRRRRRPRRELRRQARLVCQRRQAQCLRSRRRAVAACDRGRRACGHGLRRRAPLPDRRGPHPEDRSETGRVLAAIPAPGGGGELGPRLGRGRSLGRAVPGAEDPPDRSRDGCNSAHHRIEPLRDRGDLGRWRALARHLGRRRDRAEAGRSSNRGGAGEDRDAVWRGRLRAGIRRRRPVLLRRRQQRQGAGRSAAAFRPSGSPSRISTTSANRLRWRSDAACDGC